MTHPPTTLSGADLVDLERAEEVIGWYEEPDQPLGEREDETFRHLLKYHLSNEDEALFAELRQRFTDASSPATQAAVAREICAWLDELLSPDRGGALGDGFVEADCDGYPGDGEHTYCTRSPVTMMQSIRD